MELFLIVSALVLGLVQVAKKAGMSSKYAPLLAVILGIVLAGLLGGFTADVCINTGLVAALSAMGLYSGAKKSIEG